MSNLSQFSGGAIKSIQRGVISLPTSVALTETATLSPAVDTAKTELRCLGNAREDGTETAHLTLTNSTTVTLTRLTIGLAISVSWELTEFY